MPAHVLVATDFSDRSRAALRWAVGAARALGAEIDVLHVVPAPPKTRPVIDATLRRQMPQVDDRIVSGAEHELRRFLGSVAHAGVTIRTLVEPGDPAATTVRIARELPSDLIVIGTHARTGVAELVLGSVAHRIITCAPCPVVTMRGDETTGVRVCCPA